MSIPSSAKSSLDRTTPALPATHILQSRSLTVEVMDPNSPERYNQGVRFSPVANVLRVRRAGREYLASPLDHDPAFENGGLAMEFDLENPDGPPGFNEAAMGDGFVKIGVGILQKTTESYWFWPQHPVIERAKTDAKWEKDRAFFEQVCGGVNGYAYRLNAEVRVHRSTVTLVYRLTNTGKRPLASEQYAHNYFRFDGHPVGPGYTLSFPYPVSAPPAETHTIKRGPRAIVFSEVLQEAVNIRVNSSENWAGPNELRVSCAPVKMAVSAVTSLPPLRTMVHASEQYVCPEQFVFLRLGPGESAEWSRSYTFGRS